MRQRTGSTTLSRGRLTALLATAMVGAAPLAACGEPAPLESLTEQQRTQFAAAWTARIDATDPAVVPPEQRSARVTALYQRCEALDRTSALLETLSEACRPLAASTKLAALIPERCAKPTAQCTRALDRMSESTREISGKIGALDAMIERTIPDGACRQELDLTQAQITSYDGLSQAYEVWALGIERRDDDIAALGRRRADDARALMTRRGTAAEQTERFRTACDLS